MTFRFVCADKVIARWSCQFVRLQLQVSGLANSQLEIDLFSYDNFRDGCRSVLEGSGGVAPISMIERGFSESV